MGFCSSFFDFSKKMTPFLERKEEKILLKSIGYSISLQRKIWDHSWTLYACES
jgi:hypothetical protein